MDRNSNRYEGSTLFADIWRYRWIVLGIVVTFAALALAVGLTRPATYAASSSLVIQDPRSSSLFGSLTGVSPTRYLADQVAILQSGAVAQRAAEIVAAESPENEIDAFTFLTESRITGTPDSNFILITFRAPQAESAILGANALADAYGDVRRSESVRNAASALAQLEEKILAIDTDLQRIETRIDDLRTIGPIESDLGEQYENALERLNELYSIGAGGELTVEERLELTDLADQVIIIQRVAGFESASSELTALLQDQTEAIKRRSVLRIERDEIEIDTELQSQSISLFSPALEAEVGGSTPRLSLVIGLLLGAMVGTAVAYLLAARSQAFAGRLEPEAVLRAPLLAEVPDFREEGLSSQLPVRDSPKSASAEAFRFAVAGIEMQAATRLAGDSPATEKPVKSLAVISGRVGDGKTTVAANLALAAAKRGSRVLVIDADFGDQQLAGHLSSSPGKHLGITEIVEKGSQLDVAVEQIELAPGVHFDLLGRGRVNISAPEFFRSAGAREFFNAVIEEYDLVLIDTPPILQAAYASLVTRYVDRALVVVKHGSSPVLLEDVRDRLSLVGTPVAGYVYNRAPLRKEFVGLEGSMKDVVGDV